MIRAALLLTALALPAHAAQTESEYRDMLCGGQGWQMEVRLPNGTRADCMTDRLAIEIDFGQHWAEAIGQSLNYAAVTGKQPAVILICKRGTEAKCLNWSLLLSETASCWRLPIVVWNCPANVTTLEECKIQDFSAVNSGECR